MDVYKLGQNEESNTGKHVLITIELVDSIIDMSSFQEDIVRYRHTLLNDFYFPYKINCGKVTRISSLDERQELKKATIKTSLHGELELEVGKFFKIKNYDFTRPEEKNNYSFIVYKYKAGVLNESRYVDSKTTGVRYFYKSNGKIVEKNYYKHGQTIRRHEYYDNPFNTLKALFIYSDAGVLQNEFVYDVYENLIKQHIYSEDGSIFKTIVYSEDESDLPSPASKKHGRPAIQDVQETDEDDDNESGEYDEL